MQAPLHEFLAGHHRQILDLVVHKMKEHAPARPEAQFKEGLSLLIDEVTRALQHKAGIPVSSPLPGPSASASSFGARRQEEHEAVATVVSDIGAISSAVGELASAHDLSFKASEYQTFNQCIDSIVGSALESYWQHGQAALQQVDAQRLGLLAHELRNALGSARMALAVIKRGQVGIHSRTGTVLENSLARMQDLIDQTLLAVQLNVGGPRLKQRVWLHNLLHQLEVRAVSERGVLVGVDIQDMLAVDSDERQLLLAVSKLLHNAIKFTRAGGRVILRVRREEQRALIEVEDECGGLPPDKLEELSAATASTNPEPDAKGVRLGLAITREAVQANGGELSVRNLPSKGCVFTIALPVAEAQ